MHGASRLPEETRHALEVLVGSNGLIEDPGRPRAYEAATRTTRSGTPPGVAPCVKR